ncbi:MAG: type II toxin-antitoxin system prevent-host-death family antitoxin [Bacillota bacterium]|nr:type II toxin-antitoxin system prevent-host-death family antitoxin [Bacillota bacterium]
MKRTTVGIREAKANLSRLLKDVQKGAEILLTDRGRPIGKIVPVNLNNLSLKQRINALERNGAIETAKDTSKVLSPLSVEKDIAQKILLEDRES